MARKRLRPAEIERLRTDLNKLRQRLGESAGPGHLFDQIERATLAAEANRIERAAFSMYRWKPNEPKAKALWHDAVETLHSSIQAAYAPDFWESYDRLRAGDLAGMEAAVAFLESDPWFFRSGYIKESLIKFINRL